MSSLSKSASFAVQSSGFQSRPSRSSSQSARGLSATRLAQSPSAAAASVVVRSSRVSAAQALPSSRSGLSRSATFAGLGQNRNNVTYNSQVEQTLRNARTPVQFNARERVNVGPYSGVQLNRHEEQQFRGPVPLNQYRINQDSNPEVIRKQSQPVRYRQEVAVRHLRPPTPPRHGDLVIRERQAQVPAAPPVVLRQEGQRARTPTPLVYREQPPRPPTRIPEQVVEVEGQPIPPPARKVVVERLPDQPAKPQNILIEKWLPYKPQKRRVVFQRSCAAPPPNPRNLIIEWEQPCVQVEQVCKDLGVVDADPEEYRRRYACELRRPEDIPNLCQNNACGGNGLSRSASAAAGLQLEGDVDALRLVDLDRHGLGEYRRFVQ